MMSVCHGDIWSANLTFDASDIGKLVAIVDWQCAVIGPALNDVAFLLISRHVPKSTRQAHPDPHRGATDSV
jgi:Ser/Thr protein kinase RdoA (MazF antagonist)